ncbi:MAG: serine hydrolase domain-containing protein [Sphingomonadales bacterium]
MKKYIILAILIAAGVTIGLNFYSIQKEELETGGANPLPQIVEEKSHIDGAINEVLSEIYPEDGPGVGAILYKGDEILYRGGHGLSNLELHIPNKAETVFRLGSISKQFTAAGIMLLKEEGKLEIDDPITKFLPTYPTNGHVITIRNLLTHTSGIKNYTAMQEFQNIVGQEMTVDEMVDFFKNEPINFVPGEKYSYSNSGYFLLGVIIEKISGITYENFIQERIFTYLSLDNSYYGDFNRIINNRATGYSQGEEGLINSNYMSMSIPYAAGSLISNVDDMAKWNKALFAGKVVSQDSLREMTSPFTLNNGEISNYGFGLGIRTFKGQPMISHGGGIFGFSTNGAYLPESDIYVAILGNTDFQTRGYESAKMLAIALGDPYRKIISQNVDDSILASYSGTYNIEESSIPTDISPGTSLVVTYTSDALSLSYAGAPSAELISVSNSMFYMKNSFSHIEFIPLESGGFDLVFKLNESNGNKGQVAKLSTQE